MNAITVTAINLIRDWFVRTITLNNVMPHEAAAIRSKLEVMPSTTGADEYVCDCLYLIATMHDRNRRHFHNTALHDIIDRAVLVPVTWYDALDIHLRMHLCDWLASYNRHMEEFVMIETWAMKYLAYTEMYIEGMTAAHWFILSIFESTIATVRDDDDNDTRTLDAAVRSITYYTDPHVFSDVRANLFPSVFAYVDAASLTNENSPVFSMNMIDIIIDACVSYYVRTGQMPLATRDIHGTFMARARFNVTSDHVLHRIMITARCDNSNNNQYPITGAYLVFRFMLNPAPFRQARIFRSATSTTSFTTIPMIVIRNRLLSPSELILFATYFCQAFEFYLTVDDDTVLSYIAKHYGDEYRVGFLLIADSFASRGLVEQIDA